MLRLLFSKPVLILCGIALARWVMQGRERPGPSGRLSRSRMAGDTGVRTGEREVLPPPGTGAAGAPPTS